MDKDNFLSKKNNGFIEYIRELYYHCTFINPYNHYVCFQLNLQLQPSKQEFPPLFSSGFHDIEIEQFDRYFIEPFEEKERRLFLKERFFALLNELYQIGIDFEMWLDGSYATKKEKPNDIDLMLICKLEDEDKLSVEKHQDFDYLANSRETRDRYHCDLKFAYSDYSPHLEVIERYRELYGFSRNKEPKGIPRFKHVANSQNEIVD